MIRRILKSSEKLSGKEGSNLFSNVPELAKTECQEQTTFDGIILLSFKTKLPQLLKRLRRNLRFQLFPSL